LIPITGIALVLQQLLEGNTAAVIQFGPVVLGVTLLCCFFSVRFAVRRFNRESILLGDVQKFDLARWCRALLTNRKECPTYAAAILFGLTLLTLKYFVGFTATVPTSFWDIAVSSVIMQAGVLLLPALCFVFLFTTKPLGAIALEIRSTKNTIWNVTLSCLAAYFFLPTIVQFQNVVQALYPVSEGVVSQLTEMQQIASGASLLAVIFVFACLPAICEEVAFRGAMLGGLLPRGKRIDYEGTFEAIVISAVFFGVIHGILQQSISATLLGCLLGLIAVRTGSLYPCIAYHFTHNAIVAGTMCGATSTEIPYISPIVAFLLGAVAIACLKNRSR